MPEPTEFGRAVARMRLTRGWSQETVARKAGVSTGYIGQIETGHAGRRPSRDLVIRISRAYEADPNELLEAAGLPGVESGDAAGVSVEQAIQADRRLRPREKALLIEQYRLYVELRPRDRR